MRELPGRRRMIARPMKLRGGARGFIAVGAPSIIVIFVILCLVCFAALSLVSANAEMRLAQRQGENTARWYRADAEAQRRLARLDELIAAGIMNEPGAEETLAAERFSLAEEEGASYIAFYTKVTDYTALETEVSNALAVAANIVLATGASSRITARAMSPVNIGLNVYMQTSRSFTKTGQMMQNPNVALCLGNIQIEGAAEFLGHPMRDGNEAFRKLYMEKHRGSYERYSMLEDEIVFMVRAAHVTLWKYIDGKPCRDLLDVLQRTAVREYFD
jgi:hypothetical protein